MMDPKQAYRIQKNLMNAKINNLDYTQSVSLVLALIC